MRGKAGNSYERATILLIIGKFLSGHATSEEELLLNNWLAHPQNRAEFEEISKAWGVSVRNDQRQNTDVFYEGLRQIQKTMRKRVAASVRRKRILYMIFVLVIILVASLLFITIPAKNRDPLIFPEQTDIKTVMRELERRYGITLIIADDSILDCRFKGVFAASAGPEYVMATLQRSIGVDYVFLDDRRVRITGKGCR